MLSDDGSARILLIDDDHLNRRLLEVMLASDGYRIDTASGGAEGLERIAETPPDLILLDVMMPGMDGYQVAESLKSNAETRHIPIIMVTALDDRESMLIGLRAGVEDFLTKPVDRSELALKVQGLLRLKAYGDHFGQYSRTLETEVAARTAELEERNATLAQHAALLHLAHDAILVCDREDRIQFWSRGAEAMYGWTSEEAMGRAKRPLLQESMHVPAADIDAALIQHGRWDGEVTHRTRDGARVIVASRRALRRDADGTALQVLSINSDITTRKQAEKDRAVMERLALATEVAHLGVWELDTVTGTLSWDDTMYEIYGIAPGQAMSNERWLAAVHPEDRASIGPADGHGGSTRADAEFRIRRPDGTVRYVAAANRAVYDEDGSVRRRIGVNMDVTARREAEEAAKHKRDEQLRFKNEFLSHVSHELRSPLTAIKQFTSILAGGIAGPMSPEQQEYQGIVLKNVQQLQSMIDDLLVVTRLESGKLTVHPASTTVEEAVTEAIATLDPTARNKGVAITKELPADLPPAFADPVRLRQVLIVLLDNAVKFTPAGGSVTVQAALEVDDPEQLRVDVTDTGYGIDPAAADRIFERLYQESGADTSRKGLGLGLYIAKDLVTRQGGRISVDSVPQEGTTFSFTLPRFSHQRELAQCLWTGARTCPRSSMALLTVHLSRGGARPDASMVSEARDAVRRCLREEADVLLPTTIPEGRSECILAVVFSDDTGASAVSDRIRTHFRHHALGDSTAVSVAVGYHMIPPVAPTSDPAPEEVLALMVATVADAIETYAPTERAS